MARISIWKGVESGIQPYKSIACVRWISPLRMISNPSRGG